MGKICEGRMRLMTFLLNSTIGSSYVFKRPTSERVYRHYLNYHAEEINRSNYESF